MFLHKYYPDGETVDFNGSSKLEALYDSTYFEANTQYSSQYTFKNNLGTLRTFTPALYSNTTLVNLGTTGTSTGLFTRVRTKAAILNRTTSENQDYYLTYFEVGFVFGGTGISVAAGNLNFRDTFGVLGAMQFGSTNSVQGMYGNAVLLDSSAASRKMYHLFPQNTTGNGDRVYMKTDATSTFATNSSPWTWATGDTVRATGWCITPVLRTAAFT